MCSSHPCAKGFSHQKGFVSKMLLLVNYWENACTVAAFQGCLQFCARKKYTGERNSFRSWCPLHCKNRYKPFWFYNVIILSLLVTVELPWFHATHIFPSPSAVTVTTISRLDRSLYLKINHEAYLKQHICWKKRVKEATKCLCTLLMSWRSRFSLCYC